jgi:hypothetical protein
LMPFRPVSSKIARMRRQHGAFLRKGILHSGHFIFTMFPQVLNVFRANKKPPKRFFV